KYFTSENDQLVGRVNMIKNILSALLIGVSGISSAVMIAAPARAEETQAARINVRGSIVSYSGSTLEVKTREGETLAVALAEGWQVSSVAKADVTDIKPGDFVGIASLPKEGGGDGAL